MASEQTTYELTAEGIMIVLVGKRDSHTLQLAQEDIGHIRGELRGDKVPLLIDLTHAKSIDTDAREYYARESPSIATCVGLVTPSLVSKILGNFFIATSSFFATRNNLPLRLFDDRNSAIDWLKSMHGEQALRKPA